MKTIRIRNYDNLPPSYTGIVQMPKSKFWLKEGELHRENGPAKEWIDGSNFWYLNGLAHRIDGPAKEWENGIVKEWWVEGKEYKQINLKDYVVLDYYKGDYDLMWYKILGKNKIFEYPDIPGLITK